MAISRIKQSYLVTIQEVQRMLLPGGIKNPLCGPKAKMKGEGMELNSLQETSVTSDPAEIIQHHHSQLSTWFSF